MTQNSNNISIPEVIIHNVSNKRPKKILFFSDGILEESSSEDEVDNKKLQQPIIDTKNLSWMPYIWNRTTTVAGKTLEVCDYLGENLASFFGITSPKYQYAIDEHHKKTKEEEVEQYELKQWNNKIEDKKDSFNSDVISSQPQDIEVQQKY